MIRICVQEQHVPGTSLEDKFETATAWGFDGIESLTWTCPIYVAASRYAAAGSASSMFWWLSLIHI